MAEEGVLKQVQEKKKGTHGGARKGSGRPAKQIGMKFDWLKRYFGVDLNSDELSPREMMRTAARVMFRAAFRKPGIVDRTLLAEAMKYAKDAAPYYDPHLSWQSMGGRGGGALDLVAVGGGLHVYMPDNGRRNVPLPPMPGEVIEHAHAAGSNGSGEAPPAKAVG